MWSVVQVPAVEEEDQRHLHPELVTLKREQTRQINRVKGLLASQGLRIRLRADGGSAGRRRASARRSIAFPKALSFCGYPSRKALAVLLAAMTAVEWNLPAD